MATGYLQPNVTFGKYVPPKEYVPPTVTNTSERAPIQKNVVESGQYFKTPEQMKAQAVQQANQLAANPVDRFAAPEGSGGRVIVPNNSGTGSGLGGSLGAPKPTTNIYANARANTPKANTVLQGQTGAFGAMWNAEKAAETVASTETTVNELSGQLAGSENDRYIADINNAISLAKSNNEDTTSLIAQKRARLKAMFDQQKGAGAFESAEETTQKSQLERVTGFKQTGRDISLSASRKSELQVLMEEQEAKAAAEEQRQQQAALAQKELLEAQADQAYTSAKAELDSAKSVEEERLKTERDDRIKQMKEMLNSSGRLTTDASGNLSTDAMALLDEMTARANKTYDKGIVDIGTRYDSSLRATNAARSKATTDAGIAYGTLNQKIMEARGTREQEMTKLMITEQMKRDTEAAKSSAEKQTTDIQNYQYAVQTGYKGSFNDYQMQSKTGAKGETMTIEGMPYTKDPVTGQWIPDTVTGQQAPMGYKDAREYESLLKSLGGVKLTDKENARVENLFKKGKAEGLDLKQIKRDLTNFVNIPEKDKALAEAVYDMMGGEEVPYSIQTSIGEKMSSGNERKIMTAIGDLERTKMPQENGFSVATTSNILKQTQDVLDLLQDKTVAEFMGEWDSSVVDVYSTIGNKVFEKILSSMGVGEDTAGYRKAIRLGAKMARIMSADRKGFGGTSLTENEQAFLSPMIASMADQPWAAQEKMISMAEDLFNKHNETRRSEGLPVLRNEADLFDDRSKLDMYREFSKEFAAQDTTDNKITGGGESSAVKTPTGEMQLLERPRNTGNVANDLNNPTNLTTKGDNSFAGDKFASGYTSVTDAKGVTRKFLVFDSPEDGIKAARADLQAKISGGSSVIKPTDTIEKLARTWVGADISQSYIDTLAKALGVDPKKAKINEFDALDLANTFPIPEGFTGGMASAQKAETTIDKTHTDYFDSL